MGTERGLKGRPVQLWLESAVLRAALLLLVQMERLVMAAQTVCWSSSSSFRFRYIPHKTVLLLLLLLLLFSPLFLLLQQRTVGRSMFRDSGLAEAVPWAPLR